MRGLLCAAACLPVGFAVAALTGVRPLGGIVLLALAALAVFWGRAPRSRIAIWGVVVLACFAGSHALADPLGTWGAIALVTAVATAAYAALVD